MTLRAILVSMLLAVPGLAGTPVPFYIDHTTRTQADARVILNAPGNVFVGVIDATASNVFKLQPKTTLPAAFEGGMIYDGANDKFLISTNGSTWYDFVGAAAGAVSTSTVIATWASNTAYWASNAASWASNTAFWSSNTAYWASNTAAYASNQTVQLYLDLSSVSNIAWWASNAAVVLQNQTNSWYPRSNPSNYVTAAVTAGVLTVESDPLSVKTNSGNANLGGLRGTNAANGIASNDLAALGQVQSATGSMTHVAAMNVRGTEPTNYYPYPSATMTNLVSMVIATNLDYATYLFPRSGTNATSWGLSVLDGYGFRTDSVPVNVLFVSSITSATYTAFVPPDTNYWQDPLVSYLSFATKWSTNWLGHATNLAVNPLAMSNLPSVVSGPAWAYPYTNSQGVAMAVPSFDGSDDRVSVESGQGTQLTPDGTNDVPFTLMGWYYGTAASTFSLFNKNDLARGYNLIVINGSYEDFRMYSTNTALIGRYADAGPTGVWRFVMLTYNAKSNGTSLAMYRSTNSATLQSVGTTWTSGTYLGLSKGTDKLGLGGIARYAGSLLTGKLGPARIYYGTNISLSEGSNYMRYTCPTNYLVNP